MSGRASHESRLGALAALGAAVLWGTSWMTIAVALADMPVLGVSFLRGTVQAVGLGAALVFLSLRYAEFSWAVRPWRLKRRQLAVLAGLGLLGGLFNVTQAFAVDLAGTSIAALVGTQYPLVAAVLAPSLLGERLTQRRLGALALTSVGVMMLGLPLFGDPTRLAGLMMAAIGAFTFGLYLVASRRLMARYELPALGPTLAVFVGAALLSAPVFGGSAQPILNLELASLTALAWLVIGAGIVPLALVEFAVRTMPAVRISPYLFVTPIVGAGLGMAVLGDRLEVVQLVGTALAIIGIAIATFRQEPMPTEPGVKDLRQVRGEPQSG